MHVLQSHIDYRGLAVLITAIAGVIASLGTVVLQIVVVLKQGKNSEILRKIHGGVDNATNGITK